MHYTIYRITNLINSKYYIGKHQTEDLNDGYMGSGKLIKRAIAKYGIENFQKEILFDFDNEEDMAAKEKELVVISENTYNLCEGGNGGFGYINRMIDRSESQRRNSLIKSFKLKHDPIFRANFCAKVSEGNRKKSPITNETREKLKVRFSGTNNPFYGKKHSSETLAKMKAYGKTKLGNKNPSFGTCWITNGIENKKIKKDNLNEWLLIGYTKGRTIRSFD